MIDAVRLVRLPYHLSAITQATGLQFVYDGLSDEPVAEDREPYQPDRYGDRASQRLPRNDVI